MTTKAYVFDPCILSDDELWELVNQYEEFQKRGVIGDCQLRGIAEREEQNDGIVSNLLIIRMAMVAYRSSIEILHRKFPHRFNEE